MGVGGENPRPPAYPDTVPTTPRRAASILTALPVPDISEPQSWHPSLPERWGYCSLASFALNVPVQPSILGGAVADRAATTNHAGLDAPEAVGVGVDHWASQRSMRRFPARLEGRVASVNTTPGRHLRPRDMANIPTTKKCVKSSAAGQRPNLLLDNRKITVSGASMADKVAYECGPMLQGYLASGMFATIHVCRVSGGPGSMARRGAVGARSAVFTVAPSRCAPSR